MTRIKAGVTAHRRHKKTLKLAKGFIQGRRRLIRIANETVMKGLAYAYRDRRARKGDMRRLRTLLTPVTDAEPSTACPVTKRSSSRCVTP